MKTIAFPDNMEIVKGNSMIYRKSGLITILQDKTTGNTALYLCKLKDDGTYKWSKIPCNGYQPVVGVNIAKNVGKGFLVLVAKEEEQQILSFIDNGTAIIQKSSVEIPSNKFIPQNTYLTFSDGSENNPEKRYFNYLLFILKDREGNNESPAYYQYRFPATETKLSRAEKEGYSPVIPADDSIVIGFDGLVYHKGVHVILENEATNTYEPFSFRCDSSCKDTDAAIFDYQEEVYKGYCQGAVINFPSFVTLDHKFNFFWNQDCETVEIHGSDMDDAQAIFAAPSGTQYIENYPCVTFGEEFGMIVLQDTRTHLIQFSYLNDINSEVTILPTQPDLLPLQSYPMDARGDFYALVYGTDDTPEGIAIIDKPTNI